MLSSQELQPGTLIAGRYQIIELVGSGGMGSVYRARDTAMNSEIALKTLRDEYSEDAVYVERFMREVELMNKIDHPNVVHTLDIGNDNGMLFYTMEFVRGTSLEEILEHGPFPLQDIPRLVLQICEGLQAIHSAEIIHRDLKPGNVLLLDNGGLKITDFGVARPKVSNLTRKDQRVGSIWYMSPESWQGKKAARSSDLYSLGILIYEATTGVLPFEGDTPAELMKQHLTSKVVQPSRLKPEVPGWLNNIILKLLAKIPDDRPQTAADVAALIQQNLRTSSGGAKPGVSSAQNQKISAQSIKAWRKVTAEQISPPAKETRRKRTRRKRNEKLKKIAFAVAAVLFIAGLAYRYLA